MYVPKFTYICVHILHRAGPDSNLYFSLPASLMVHPFYNLCYESECHVEDGCPCVCVCPLQSFFTLYILNSTETFM